MKNIIKKLALTFCAVLMSFSFRMNVSAEENNYTLPSGLTVRRFEEQIKNISHQDDYASALIGLFQDDSILYTGYFGYSDIENKIPADENSVYEWGSISKTLIWVSAMQLWEQGRLDLERDIREYLPEGFFQHLSYDDPITMLNLMNHNAGWQETTRPIQVDCEKDVISLGEALKKIEPAQIHRPNEVVAYSNYGSAVAGYVIECITGQNYCEYVKENIFEPLGMKQTSLSPIHNDNKFVYENRKNMKSYRFSLGNRINMGNCLDYILIYPAGSATGTLSDMIIYGQALMNDDAPLFQSPETQKIMFTGTYFYGDSDIPICMHGFWCNERAVRTYGHTGATNFGQANLELDFTSKTGLAVMVNEPEGNDFLSYSSTYVFGELPVNKYVSNSTEKIMLKGHYLISRSTHSGMFKFLPYINALSGKSLGELEKIDGSLHQCVIPQILNPNEETAVLINVKNNADGNISIEQPSVEVTRDKFYAVKLCLLVVYVLLSIMSVFGLFIRHKLKKHKKYQAYKGSGFIIASQISWLISVSLLLLSYILYTKNTGGISYGISAVIGISQMICMAVCGTSIIVSVINLIKEKSHLYNYIFNSFGNLIMITTAFYFELYHFWEM